MIDVVSRVEELTDSRVRQVEERYSIKLIIESLRNTLFWRNIKLILNNKMSFAEFEVPKTIIDAEPQIKKEFVRGFADVAGSARFSNRDEAGKCRIYLDVLNQNWILPVQMCYLLQDGLGVPVRNITWGHPNIRDPALKDYNKNKRDAWAREHQIRVYAEDFLKIGFYIRHKQEILEELAQYNKEKFSESNFCSPPKTRIREKQNHPEEESDKLPQRIRGKHYDAYWQICCDLGCVRCEKTEPPA
ncbi:MAG: hypothetical protein KIH10_12790 [Candidatus Freyarchaeota archaeon]|nr:hypothetical protein [Candidatus Jordarchaeia archaeon]